MLRSRQGLLAGGVLIGAVLLAYFPALHGGFIFDDIPFLVHNTLIRSSAGLRHFWFSTQQTDYWPVTYTGLWLEWRLWGLHTIGYHAVNLALHAGECLLLWTILRRLAIPGAWLAALLFAVHPVNVESVAWIIQFKNLAAMLFFLLSILCFIRLEEGGGRGEDRPLLRYVVSLVIFAAAMLSKGSVAILPVVLLGLTAWRRPLRARDALWSLPYFAVAAALALTDIWFQKHGTGEVFRHAGPLERLLEAGGVIWFYLGKALLPLDLVFVYPAWHLLPSHALAWVPLAAVVAVTAALIRLRRGPARPALFAWGYFCVALLPVMGFTDVYFMKFSLVADHYEHLALIGVVAWAGAMWGKWERAFPVSYVPKAAALAVVCVLMILTWRQASLYRDGYTLWSSVLRRNPDSLLAQDNLGEVLYTSGHTSEALARYEREARVNPGDAEAHNNIGMILAGRGKEAEAAAQFEEALRIRPNYPDALANRANIRQKEGRHFEAMQDYEEAVRLDPDNAGARDSYGIALAAQGALPEALAQFEAAVRLRPDRADAYRNRANVLSGLNRIPEAIADYRQALRLAPGDAAAHAGLAAALAAAGSLPEAAAEYAAAVRLTPDVAEIHYNLGGVLAQAGRTPEAIAQFEEAIRLKPDYAEAHANLGTALVNEGRLPEALAELERASQLSPGYAQIHYNLGAVLHAMGREEESKAEFDAASRLGGPH